MKSNVIAPARQLTGHHRLQCAERANNGASVGRCLFTADGSNRDPRVSRVQGRIIRLPSQNQKAEVTRFQCWQLMGSEIGLKA